MNSLQVPPPLVSMDGFSNSLIYDDTLHVAYRGFGPDFVASALVCMFGRGMELQRACNMAADWARSHNYYLSIDEFSLSDDKFPALNAKGWEVKLLCLWMAEIAPAYARSEKASSDRQFAYVLSMTARALAMNIKILDKTIYAVAHEDVDAGISACHRFIEGYCWLAFACHVEGRKLFKLRPKRLGSVILYVP
ncbi:unnamed protein product [Symbiodinium sp. CCMP2592]|nr:unnamed protein product [Symbiodinium sp. CCMP2592]